MCRHQPSLGAARGPGRGHLCKLDRAGIGPGASASSGVQAWLVTAPLGGSGTSGVGVEQALAGNGRRRDKPGVGTRVGVVGVAGPLGCTLAVAVMR